ncbi:MAG: lipopolysaccharide biosynthesis protein, partial [Muribaculaceae bacterium]|nr:lipopolysaccharide biosynthesis protein [Muribaculaceae bacterium]
MSQTPKNNTPADPADGRELKTLTARSVKWNIIDRVSSQLLYAVTGVVLARLLSQDDFGLVGAMLVFQAFATLFVDSGFSYALIQRKAPTRLDYSTVLWFNLLVACAVYVVLYFAAPLIADCFQGDRRLIPMSRVMFLSFILNASAIVQTNRLMKRMDVKMVAVSNSVGLFAGAIVGISLALGGYGAWAIVWQTVTLNGIKSLVLWLTSGWRPLWRFSAASLRSFFAVGWGMMGTSFLNTLFQNIYSFVIGNRAGLAPLGYYSQADKWSKMGITSISQVLTSSFLPALSEVQDDPERFSRISARMNRFTSYLLFPAMGFLALLAEPIFHCLFGEKWDASIILFQLLLVRGVFTVLSSLYNNYAVAV